MKPYLLVPVVVLVACTDEPEPTSTTCGNGRIDSPELCDGANLTGLTCANFGMSGGTLACNGSCSGFDLSGCVHSAVCGDDRVDEPEVCDRLNLAGNDCEGLGFSGGGELACDGSCEAFDVTGCLGSRSCGNDAIEDPELCDGDALGGTECAHFGFTTGELVCNDDCGGFDVSGCLAGPTCATDGDCGSGRCEPTWQVCVDCLVDDDCPCHMRCSDWECLPLGASVAGMATSAHGTWTGMPGQPDYDFVGFCAADSECGSGRLCNPFTAGCLLASSVTNSCAIGPCANGTSCDSVSQMCFPAPLCMSDHHCCGAAGVVCGDSTGLCHAPVCTPPNLVVSECPMSPRLEGDCAGGGEFCSPDGRCVECVCDADCSGSRPRCDKVAGRCVGVDFCRQTEDCVDANDVCDPWSFLCVPPCTGPGVCDAGELCDPLTQTCRCATDSYEPNDSSNGALPELVMAGEVGIDANLCELDDDWFLVNLALDEHITVSSSSPSGLAAAFEVLGPDGLTQVASGNIGDAVTFVVAEAGDHLLHVGGTDVGAYHVNLAPAPVSNCDRLGTDDTPAQAIAANSAPLPDGCTLTAGSLDDLHVVVCGARICSDDVDHYRIAVPDGMSLNVVVSDFPGADLDIELYGPFFPGETPDDTRLVMIANTDEPVETVTAATRLAATFLVRVLGFFGSSSDYQLELDLQTSVDPTCTEDILDVDTASPEPFDVSGFNDDADHASGVVVQPGAPASLDLSMCSDDEDWLQVGRDSGGVLEAPPVGHRWTAEVAVATPGPATELRVAMGSDPFAVAQQLSQTGSPTQVFVSDGGLPYVAVTRNRAEAPAQSYTLVVTEVAPPACDLDDLGDLGPTIRNEIPADATVLPSPPWPSTLGDPTYSFPPNVSQHLSSCTSDMDWYRLDNPVDVLVAASVSYAVDGVSELGLAIYDDTVVGTTPPGPGIPPTEGLLDLSTEDGAGQQSVMGDTGGTAAYVLVYNRGGWPVMDYTLTLAASAVAIFTDPVGGPIPDGLPSTSTCGLSGALARSFDVSATSYIYDVNVIVDISHNYTADLEMFLEFDNHGDPMCVELSTGNGGSGSGFVDTQFDDQAASPITAGAPPFTGSYRPESPLAALRNLTMDGVWTLWVSDSFSGDVGTLNSWSLVIERSAQPGLPLPPMGMRAQSADGQATVFWGPVASATSYNLYWSTVPGVSVATGTRIASVASPHTHAPLVNGTTYYYVVTAVNVVGESSESSEVAATPGPHLIATAKPEVGIPDDGGDAVGCGTVAKSVSSIIDIVSTQVITDVDVTVNLTHTFTGDLALYLEFDNHGGVPICVELSTENGGGGDNYVDSRFDDEATVSIVGGFAPFTGSFQPEGSLADLDGVAMDGDWTLWVSDGAGADTGVLHDWSLEIQYVP